MSEKQDGVSVLKDCPVRLTPDLHVVLQLGLNTALSQIRKVSAIEKASNLHKLSSLYAQN